MSRDLWLPSGARRFDADIERVIEESDDPAQMRAAAEDLHEAGFKFPLDRFGDAVAPDSAVLLFASRWTRITNDRDEHPLAAVVKSDEIERMILDGNLHYENGMVVNWAEHPILNALCPALVVRLKEFQTFTPLEYEEAGRAPDGWQEVLQSDGFALAMEQDDDRFIYFSTGPLRDVEGLVVPGRSRVKVGRNEKCPCGSGVKYKFCCHR